MLQRSVQRLNHAVPSSTYLALANASVNRFPVDVPHHIHLAVKVLSNLSARTIAVLLREMQDLPKLLELAQRTEQMLEK